MTETVARETARFFLDVSEEHHICDLAIHHAVIKTITVILGGSACAIVGGFGEKSEALLDSWMSTLKEDVISFRNEVDADRAAERRKMS